VKAGIHTIYFPVKTTRDHKLFPKKGESAVITTHITRKSFLSLVFHFHYIRNLKN